MADIYDEEYVNRKLAEVIHCKTCGQFMTPELQQWTWKHLQNGDRKWCLKVACCKPCLSQKSAEKQFKKRNASQEAREQFNARSREYKNKYFANPANRLKRTVREKKSCYFKTFCRYVYKTFKPLGLSDSKEDLLSTLKKEIQRRIRDESTPEIEIAAFYAAQGKPWANPRLSCAEAFRIRYKIDKEFRERQKAKNRTVRLLETKEQKYMRKHTGHRRRIKRQKEQKDNTLNAERIKDLLKSRQNCLYCGRTLQDSQKAIDHMMPLAKGGEHSITNLAISCKPCNNRKAAKDFLYWLQEIKPEHAERALNYYESQKSQRVQAVLAYNIS